MRSEQQKRRKRAREKEHKAVIAASPHRPGDRWQHARWPRGTPDAVVGSIRPDGLVRFSERGGCTAESLPLRLMTERNGWRKVAMGPETAAVIPVAKLGPSPAKPRPVVAPALQNARPLSLDCRGSSRLRVPEAQRPKGAR